MRISGKPANEYPFIARLIFWAQKKKYGEALEPSKLWGLSPKILYGLQVLYRAIDRKGSPIEPQLRSLIGVRISQINHCEFCTDIGSSLLQKQNVSMEKIKSVGQHAESSLFTESEKTALLYAEAMTYPDRGVSDAIFDMLRKHFNEKQIVELTAFIAYQNLSSKFNAALGVPPQGFCFIPDNKKDVSPSA